MFRVVCAYVLVVSAALIWAGDSPEQGAESFGQWSERLSVNYVVGWSESREEAIKGAREKLRERAASKVGTYIQGTERLSGGDVDEHVEVLSASVIQLNDEDREAEIIGDGQTRLTLTATARVDTDVMATRIAAIQHDRDLRQRLSELRVENQRLASEQHQHSGWSEPDSVWTSFDGFEEGRGPGQIHLSSREIVTRADQREAMWHDIREHWVSAFYEYYKEPPIEAEIERVRRARSEEDFAYEVVVSVRVPPYYDSDPFERFERLFAWYGRREPYEQTLEGVRGGYDGVSIFSWELEHPDEVGSYSDGSPLEFRHELFHWLKDNPLHLEVSLAGIDKQVPVFAQEERRRPSDDDPITYEASHDPFVFHLDESDLKRVGAVEVAFSSPVLD